MTGSRTIVIAVGGLLVAAATPALAQRWGRDRPPRDGACFYEHKDFGGDYFCVRSGDDLSAVPSGTNDTISSIRLYGRADVIVFRDTDLRGPNKRFDNDVRNLRDEGWNDRISSARVRGTGGGSGSGSGGGYRGDPDRVIRRAYQDILNRDPDNDGLRHYRRLMLDEGWSEADVREALRKSPEYREQGRMTQQKAEEIVRRAYQNVLRRDPDPASRGYVDRVLRDKWTQADVERELRKSPEYRERPR
jgi:hypothetical protein